MAARGRLELRPFWPINGIWAEADVRDKVSFGVRPEVRLVPHVEASVSLLSRSWSL
jgi:hypothetical protein